LGDKPKTLHFCVFGCKSYVFLPSKVYANKLALYFELIILIECENNSYCFIYHTQGNIILCFTHAIFDKKLFPKCTDFHAKEYKLYDKLLNKISLETELPVPDSSRKDRPTLVPILYILIPPILNNPPTYSSSSFLSYKSLSLSPTLGSKKPIIEIGENNDIDSDVEM